MYKQRELHIARNKDNTSKFFSCFNHSRFSLSISQFEIAFQTTNFKWVGLPIFPLNLSGPDSKWCVLELFTRSREPILDMAISDLLYLFYLPLSHFNSLNLWHGNIHWSNESFINFRGRRKSINFESLDQHENSQNLLHKHFFVLVILEVFRGLLSQCWHITKNLKK